MGQRLLYPSLYPFCLNFFIGHLRLCPYLIRVKPDPIQLYSFKALSPPPPPLQLLVRVIKNSKQPKPPFSLSTKNSQRFSLKLQWPMLVYWDWPNKQEGPNVE